MNVMNNGIVFLGSLLIFLVVINIRASGQLNAISISQKENFNHRVISIHDFVHIFNEGNPIDSVFQQDSTMDVNRLRKRAILSLFNRDFFLSDTTQSRTEAAKEFLDQLVDDSLFLVLSKEHWSAHVTFLVTYLNVKNKIQMNLKKEYLPDNTSKWTIQGVDAPFLYPIDAENKGFIPPNSSDINFIHVTQALEKSNDPSTFASEDFQMDYLSLFLNAIRKKELTIEHALSTTLIFNNLHGWRIEIKEFNREGLNSGWLISNLTKI